MGRTTLIFLELLLVFLTETPVASGSLTESISSRLATWKKDAFEAVDRVNDPIYDFVRKEYDVFADDIRKGIGIIQNAKIPEDVKDVLIEYVEKVKFLKDVISKKAKRKPTKESKGFIKDRVKAAIATVIDCLEHIFKKILGSRIFTLMLDIIGGFEKVVDTVLGVLKQII